MCNTLLNYSKYVSSEFDQIRLDSHLCMQRDISTARFFRSNILLNIHDSCGYFLGEHTTAKCHQQ